MSYDNEATLADHLPTCPYLVVSLEMAWFHYRNATFFRCERWRYLASANAGYLRREDIQLLCKEYGWKFSTEIKAINKGIKAGWITLGDSYHFVSGYENFYKASDSKQKGKKRTYLRTQTLNVPGWYLLNTTYLPFRGLIDGSPHKFQKEQRVSEEACVKRWEKQLKEDGFWKKKENGKFVKGSGQDLQKHKDKYKSNLPFIVPGDESNKETRFSLHRPELSGIDGRGILSETKKGKVYTQVTTDTPLESYRVGLSPAVIQKKGKRRWVDSSPFESLPLPFCDRSNFYTYQVYDTSMSVSQLAKAIGVSQATASRRIKNGFYGNVVTQRTSLVLPEGVKTNADVIPHDLYYKVIEVDLAKELWKQRKSNGSYNLFFAPGTQTFDLSKPQKVQIMKCKTAGAYILPVGGPRGRSLK